MRKRWAPLLQLFGWGARLRPGWTAAMIGLALLLGLLPAVQVVLLRAIINQVTVGITPAAIADWLGLIALCFALPTLGYSLLPVVQTGYREATTDGLRLLVLRRLATLPVIRLEEPETRDQIARVERALETALGPWADSLLWVLQSILMLLSLSVLLLQAHPLIWAVAVGGALLHLWVERLIGRNQYQLFRAQTPNQRWEAYLAELLCDPAPRRDLLAFGATKGIWQRWRTISAELLTEQLSLQRRSAWLSLGGRLLFLVAYLLLLGALVWEGARGAIDAGLVVGLLSAVGGFYAALSVLVLTASGWIGQGLAAGDLISFLIEGEVARDVGVEGQPTEDRHQNPVQSMGAPRVGVGLRCQSLTFQYPGAAHPTLTGINLQIQPGEWVAVVGANGSGKSTLARLLLGLYQPTEGSVSLTDGQDAWALNEQPGRRAGVMQPFGRYGLPLRQAVGLGHPPAIESDEALALALEQAGLAAWTAELPDGLETPLSREFGGIEPSGGQWQRLALARAALPPAGLIILDEATSALDPAAEDSLLRNLRRHFDGATLLFVAHRLPVARLADRILLIADGAIVEEGSHAALLAQGGRYASFYQAQADWYQAVGD